MKKKFLSVLLSLAMLLTLVPAALAADLTDDQKAAVEEILLAQDYTEEEIAELLAEENILVIDEDTELDEDFDGLVIVLSGCTLTIKGVKIGVGVVVLPGAEEDEEAKETQVIVSADSEVGAIVVLAANVAVTVEAGAKVDTIVVGEDAEDAEITVSEDAEVGEIEDEGENATVTEEPAEPAKEEEPANDTADTAKDSEPAFFFDIPLVLPEETVDNSTVDDGSGATPGGDPCNGGDNGNTGNGGGTTGGQTPCTSPDNQDVGGNGTAGKSL